MQFTWSKQRLEVIVAERATLRPLLSGDVIVPGYTLDVTAVDPVIGAYRRMARERAFDVCELAPTTYVMARSAGIALTAIPVFLDRRFHHADLRCAAGSGIRVPVDLQDRRVGVRAYTVTTGVWVRGLLSDLHGVDLSAVTWLVDDEDHLPVALPANVERVPSGDSLRAMLERGTIDAALGGNAGTGRVGAPHTGWARGSGGRGERENNAAGRPYALFEDADALDRQSYAQTGVYPLHAVIAIRSELVTRDPELPTALYRAFCESKQRQRREDPDWLQQSRLRRQAHQVGGDPLPYGRDVNQPSVDALVRLCRDQGLVRTPVPELFAPGDYPTS